MVLPHRKTFLQLLQILSFKPNPQHVRCYNHCFKRCNNKIFLNETNRDKLFSHYLPFPGLGSAKRAIKSNLQKRRRFVPLFTLSSFPGSKKRETDLAALVEVRVEPDDATAGRSEVDLRRAVRIFRRKVDVELVAAASVGSVFRSVTLSQTSVEFRVKH